MGWLSRTGQTWKLAIFWVGTLSGFLLFVFMILDINRGGELQIVFSLSGIAVTFGALLWLALSVRCRACGGRPAWWLVRRAPWSDWYVLLVYGERCLICLDRQE